MKKLEIYIKNIYLGDKIGTHLSEGLETYIEKTISDFDDSKCNVENMGKDCILHVVIATRTEEVIDAVSKAMTDSKLWDHEFHFNFYEIEAVGV